MDAPSLDRLHVINDDGSRRMIYPADVRGTFTRAKPWVQGALIVVYLAVPWIEVGGRPAVLLDIPGRRFYLFGNVFNAQDFALVFFLLSGVGFALIVLSALFGRVWCGWACPQTVFLEGVFRRIERWIEGPAASRRRLSKAPWTFQKIWKKGLKHVAYAATAWVIAHAFLAYFVGAERLLSMIVEGPRAHFVTFLWGLVPTGILYFNFWWFREQLCLILCPYGRLQSVLQDRDTIIIGYDEARGEPRGKKGAQGAGDCVDCRRCIAVCPTGIDIRNGLQMECIGCASCVDACDEVMDRLGRPRGLIRYDSLRGFEEGARRFWRPRVAYYALAGLAGVAVAATLFATRAPFEANVVRLPGPPYALANGVVRNQAFLHLVSKEPERSAFFVVAEADPAVEVMLPVARVELEPFESRTLPVLVSFPSERAAAGRVVHLRVRDERSGVEKHIALEVLGPPASDDEGTP